MLSAINRNVVLPETYETYESALLECSGGYNSSVLNAIRFYKAANTIESLIAGAEDVRVATEVETLAMFRSAGSATPPPLRVIDFGGGFALTYFLLKRYFSITMRWAIVETGQVVSMGKAYESEELHYFEDIETAHRWLGQIDIVHINGAIQYVPQPIIVLDGLLSLAAPNIFLLRLPLSREGLKVQIQESMLSHQYIGPLPRGVRDCTIRYPHITIDESEFRSLVAKRGYRIVSTNGQAAESDAVSVLHDNHFLLQK